MTVALAMTMAMALTLAVAMSFPRSPCRGRIETMFA